jgi:hypothetical protein
LYPCVAAPAVPEPVRLWETTCSRARRTVLCRRVVGKYSPPLWSVLPAAPTRAPAPSHSTLDS